MSAFKKSPFVSEEEYFALSEASDRRLEYMGGLVHAMQYPGLDHEMIAGNVFGALQQHLRTHASRVFQSTTRVRIAPPNFIFHYYPDVTVICGTKQSNERFRENPVLMVEVLSPSTTNTDRREKLFVCQDSESVQHYVIIAQDKKEITIYRRIPPPEGWEVEILTEDADILRAPDLGFEMTLAEVYEKVDFPSQPPEP